MHALTLIASGAAVLAFMPSVHGHGYMVHPDSQWVEGYPNNGYGSTIDNEIWGVYDNAKYGYGPNGTLKFFTETFPTKGYKSLGAFILENQELFLPKVDLNCGLTVYKDSARSELPASELTYTGFTHPGPCEVWCDDTKVLFDSDCQTTYPGKPATMPYDKSKCAGANRMTIYWLGVHGDPWQVYIDCMWLKGGSGIGAPPSAVSKGKSKGGSASNSTAASTPASATPSTTIDSSATTPAPSTATDSSATTPVPSTAVVSTEASGSDEEASSEADDSSVDEVSSSAGDSPEEETPTAETTPSVSTEQGDTVVTALPAIVAPSTSNVSTGAKCVRRRS
uniref:RxLR effector candidate protein n=1 Tax=Hyaloperonospora arabidopsidis (strain Emoy2) TaxID=559515 RepID=M4B5Y3_HYAAE